MITPRETTSLSIYFYAGNFTEAYRRFKAGEPQVYATHDEVCQLFDNLAEVGIGVSAYSFMTETSAVEKVHDRLTITSMGSSKWNDNSLIKKAIRADRSDAIIPHFGNHALLNGALKTQARTAAITAGSFNKGTVREWLSRSRLVNLYNKPKFDFIANHCLPSTLKLQEYGVNPDKLLAWDVPHKYTPSDFAMKTEAQPNRFQIAYAGVISEPKGVGDLIRAIAALKKRGQCVTAKIAGKGETDAMAGLATSLGVADQIDLLGLIPNTEVIKLFNQSDAVCVPSRPEFPEGFPLTMFEAIASRSPIVCSDHPMFRPIMRPNESASVFRAADIDDFADKIEALLNDKALYARMSANADLTWERLSQTADWRTLIFKWVTAGVEDPWIQQRTMASSRSTD